MGYGLDIIVKLGYGIWVMGYGLDIIVKLGYGLWVRPSNLQYNPMGLYKHFWPARGLYTKGDIHEGIHHRTSAKSALNAHKVNPLP